MKPLRVLVVDDHPVYRAGLMNILEDLEFDVVGEASNGVDAAALAREQKPDVVLMDLRMPEMNGVEATEAIIREDATVAVLMLTMNNDDESVLSTLRAGAMGYLLKEATKDEIGRAIYSLAQGQAVFGTGISGKVLTILRSGAQPTRGNPFPHLTDRERSVLELMAEGYSNATIARKLYVSEKTVRNNVSLVLTKLQVVDRAAAIKLAKTKWNLNPE